MTNPTPRDSAQLPPADFIADLTKSWEGPWANAADTIVHALRAQAASVEPVGKIINSGGNTGSLPEHPLLVWLGGVPPVGTELYAGAPPSPASVPGDVPSAMAVVCKALQDDPEYAWSWHCNIAMSAFDEGMGHYAANKAAARFLGLLAGVDTTKHPGFPPQHPAPSPAQAVDAVDELREALRMGVECLRNQKSLHPEDFDELDERAVALLKAALATTKESK